MTTYSYFAIDAQGRETSGTLQVADHSEALKRIKEMGFFPVKITAAPGLSLTPAQRTARHAGRLGLVSRAVHDRTIPRDRRFPARTITLFTRQLATLLQAGMPLLRSLRLLHEQETNPQFKNVLTALASSIEGGSSFSEALAQFPRAFDHLYLNLVKAGEIAGVLENSLLRLADHMEKSRRLKGKIKTAMFYPAAVMTVALGVMALLLVYIVPRFKDVFAGLTGGKPLPAFTRLILAISDTVKNNFLVTAVVIAALYALFAIFIRTRAGRRIFDRFKLTIPVLGPVFRKVAIARFTRTLGTLVTSGVPILQALTTTRDAAGNVIVAGLASQVRNNVEQGESIVGPLRESRIFPAMVVGLVDVGEQTGTLPEMLTKIADNYDEEVDNAVTAMTSLLEPVMIVFLALIVGSIVVAMFLPIIGIIMDGDNFSPHGD